MKINGYKLIGWAVMALSFANRASQADTMIRTYTGVGSEAIHPVLATVSQATLAVGEPVKQIIVETANNYWQEGVRNQSIIALRTKDVSFEEQDLVLVNNKFDHDYFQQLESRETGLAY